MSEKIKSYNNTPEPGEKSPRQNKSLSIVIPVYNSELSLPELLSKLSQVLPTIARQYELILVNDGSHDRSWGVICRFAQEFEWIRGINLTRNYGQHNAILCGIRAAEYEIIITMDDDLQHPPEEIPNLLQKLDEGYDVVYGTPQQERHSFWRSLASQIIKMTLQSATGVEVIRNVSAFRVLRTRLRDAFASYQSPFVSIDVLLTWATIRFAAIPVRHNPRFTGRSQYTPRMLITHAINMLTGFSILPLQLAIVIGFGFTLFGLLVLTYVLGVYLIQGGSVPGFPFLASIIAIFSGAQLFALGIIGEYLARMHLRTMGKPPYVIDTSYRCKG